MPSKKLILIMIDGVSADYFETHRNRLPNLFQLAERGYRVNRMKSPVPAVSMPGRASLLTGVAADKHGIYGNRLRQEGRFNPADAKDVRVPTIATLASSAGLDVACIGHALIKPEDVSLYVPPCWMRGSDFTKVTATGRDVSLLQIKDPHQRLAGIALPFGDNPSISDTAMGTAEYLIADRKIVAAAAALLRSNFAPDVIITEINATDSAQHFYGYESEEAHSAAEFADGLVGLCLDSLRHNATGDQYNLAIVSDHGHGANSKTIYVDRVVPNLVYDTEGSTVHVFVDSSSERAYAEEKLTSVGAIPLDRSYLPTELRDCVVTFAAPSGCNFANAPGDVPADSVVGDSYYKSMHGRRPGDPADDRFCLFFGTDVPVGVIETADAESFAPTVSALLDLPLTSFPGRPLFTPSVNPRSL
ncbi:alkaline phosphatase family protein [Rhizobium mongolense]|uniref:AlkP superfamily pyrophosphatase or phosphodiesterase n=3 Tax=Rhizobium mongolense TaxID=57676 RepID=A0ABR6IX77_9HYPH|nr:alkaline phosphatase family protein [Rhizobium mongolense]MBB4232527.1 putative AlkP superfamily pyrophosphatase or phosphodiesterase [Rhizobium mongolense]TVZ75034.1 putative AlkP superfamily pyrophosphatase or phosphodiesterase [Rhizobium mongolense USDA 1844]